MSSASHVLFVDASADDVDIARWHLARAGLDIRATRIETAEALRIALIGEQRIDLLVTELVLPGLSWQEVLAIVAALHPDLPCILYSGYPDRIQCERALKYGGRACIIKDDLGTFTTVVKAVLAGEPPNKEPQDTCCVGPPRSHPGNATRT